MFNRLPNIIRKPIIFYFDNEPIEALEGDTIASALLSERKYMSYLLYSWATLVAYSRIYVGKHYLLDVIGGALLGFVLAKVIWHLVIKIKEKYTLAL